MGAVVQQASFFGAMALGAYTLKLLNRKPLHPLVKEKPELCTHSPVLASLLSQLHCLDDEPGLRRLVEKTADLVAHDKAGRLSAPWRISRLSSDIVRDAKALCDQTKKTDSDELFRNVLFCTEEIIPQMESQLDDLLHNHLLMHTRAG